MGSKSTTKSEVPKYIEEAGKLALQRAQELQGLGYMPYMGPEVAAVNPYEQAMSQNVGGMASAFGMAAPSGMDMGGMPTVTQGGMTGYSSYPTYMGALEQFQQQRPDQYAGLAGMTQYDPITGMMNPNYNAPTMDIGATVGGVSGAAAPQPQRDDPSFDYHASGMGTSRGSSAPRKSGGFDPFGSTSGSTYSNSVTGRRLGLLGSTLAKGIL